jgi:predicted HD superfamily hydrolase involved in NAD metabolism
MSNKLPQPLYYFRAGLCHDIAKGVAPATIKQYLEANEASGEVLMEDQVLHQFYGAYLAKKEFNLTRGELEAIRYHTTGYKKMSPLMKVIYLVDKVEPLRKRDDDILHLAFKNYQAAFLEVVRRHEAALKQKLGKVSNIYTVSMIKSYLRSDVN